MNWKQMYNKISSKDNQKLKFLRQLKQRKFRQRSLTYIIEGERALKEALDSKDLLEVFLSQDYFESRGDYLEGIDRPLNIVDNRIFDQLSDTENSQGILATVKFSYGRFEDIQDGTYLVLDQIRDPGNLGGIIRGVDAFGLDGLIIGPGSVDPLNEKVVRSSMGSILRTKIYRLDRLDRLEDLKEKGFKILATSLDQDSIDIRKIESYNKSLIIIGSEAFGIGPGARGLADDFIHIHMPGQAESLNANVAASIIMYEAKR